MKESTLNHRLSGTDAGFFYLERKEIPLNIAAVGLLEEPVPFEKFVATLAAKLHLIPRYRQIVVAPPFNMGYPVWGDDPNFDIRNHVKHVRLPAPGGRRQLEDLVDGLVTETMDRTKPLWSIYIIDGFADGSGAIIALLNHALADGVSGASLMKVLFDSTPAPPPLPKPPAWTPKPLPQEDVSLGEALVSAVHSALQNMIAAEEVILDFGQNLFSDRAQQSLVELGRLLPELAASGDRFPFNKPCGGDRKFRWTEFPLDDAKAIKNTLGGTVNDVILTVYNRALSRYIQLHKEPVANRFIRIVCPVNVRQNDNGESMGNQISFLPVALPLDIEDPAEMLRAVARRTAIMKNVKASHLIALITAWIGSTPPPVQALFWWGLPMIPLPMSLLNTICTNVPGSPLPLYAAGKRLIALYPHVPTGYELGVNCAVHSYDGKLFYGLTADAQVCADVDKLRDLLDEAFAELCTAAGLSRPKPPAPAKRARAKAPRRPRPKKVAAKPTGEAAAEPAKASAQTTVA
jgi:diacylglycerol O-acyltransferase